MGVTLSEFGVLVNLPAISQAQQRLQIQLLSEACDLERDLLWARSAPSLMGSAAFSFDMLIPRPGRDFRADAAPMAMSGHRRLGLYYEDLIGTLLSDALPAESGSLYRNVQCGHEGVTAGEFDFLYRNAGQWFHLETAVKFYLCCGDGSALEHFVGPGRRDRLDIKWKRLQRHQLPLAKHPAGRDCLDRLGIGAVQSRLLMPGYLFYRTGVELSSSALHRDISAGHLRGWWLPLGELERLPAGADHRYAILPKLHWLAPARFGETQVLERHDLREQLAQRSGPALVAQLSRLSLEGPGNWGETSRGFVVPDTWEQAPLHKLRER